MFKIFISLLITINLFALQESEIESFMEKNINLVTKMLQAKKYDKETIGKKIFEIFDPVFNYTLMARLSLGSRVWKTLSKEQKDEFVKSFTKKLKDSYISKLDLYNDETVIVKDLKKVKKNRIHLLTELKGSKDKYDVTYKFYKARNGEWYIYDVDVLGVSIIQTYRSSFSDFLKKHSFEDLLKSLKNSKNSTK